MTSYIGASMQTTLSTARGRWQLILTIAMTRSSVFMLWSTWAVVLSNNRLVTCSACSNLVDTAFTRSASMTIWRTMTARFQKRITSVTPCRNGNICSRMSCNTTMCYRVRIISDYFRNAGFDIVEIDRERCDIEGLRIHSDWTGYSREDQETTIFTIVCRKPL